VQLNQFKCSKLTKLLLIIFGSSSPVVVALRHSSTITIINVHLPKTINFFLSAVSSGSMFFKALCLVSSLRSEWRAQQDVDLGSAADALPSAFRLGLSNDRGTRNSFAFEALQSGAVRRTVIKVTADGMLQTSMAFKAIRLSTSVRACRSLASKEVGLNFWPFLDLPVQHTQTASFTLDSAAPRSSLLLRLVARQSPGSAQFRAFRST
jgi:hypothetical protein